MDFCVLPPEVNSARMYTGPGAGPMLAAAAGWHSVAAELEYTASGYSSVVAGLSGQAWSGPSEIAMTAAAMPYVGWLNVSAVQAQQTAMQAYAAAAAYEVAFAATVHPALIAQNRALLMALVATNFFGQNSPAIAVTETHYAEMWAQDAAAMTGYASASASAGTLTPFHEPPQTSNLSGQAQQARAVAQSAGNSTGARTQSLAQLASHTGTLVSSDPVLGHGIDTITTGSESAATISTNANSTAIITLHSGTAFVYSGTSSGTTLTPSSGPYTLGPGATVIVNGGSTATLEVETGTVAIGEDGPVTITPVTSITPGAGVLGEVPGLAATSAPGLAGTAGIQPQLNVEALMGGQVVCTPARSALLGTLDAAVDPSGVGCPCEA